MSGISKYPVSEGAFCDVHEGYMEGEGKVALKRLRLLGSEAKVRKVCACALRVPSDNIMMIFWF